MGRSAAARRDAACGPAPMRAGPRPIGRPRGSSPPLARLAQGPASPSMGAGGTSCAAAGSAWRAANAVSSGAMTVSVGAAASLGRSSSGQPTVGGRAAGPAVANCSMSARCDAAISVTASILAANRRSGSGRTGPIVRTAPMRTGRWVRRSRNWHRKSASAARRTQFVRRPADPLTHRKPCRRPRARDGVSHPNSLVFEYRRSGLGGDRERIAVSRPGRQVSRSLV